MPLDLICEIMNADVIHSLLDDVEVHLSNSSSMIRRKALNVARVMYNCNSERMERFIKPMKKSLGDPDVLVMEAAVLVFKTVAKTNSRKCIGLIPAIIHIVDQIVEGRLGPMFAHNSVPAPWTLVHCIEILGCFGGLDREYSQLT
jgi:Adaptin N terminal region